MVTHLIVLYIKLGIGNPIFAAVDYSKTLSLHWYWGTMQWSFFSETVSKIWCLGVNRSSFALTPSK